MLSKTSYIWLLSLLPLFIQAQEICNNGIDDDSDNLIDLNDPDCNCSIPASVPSLLPNPSFEEYSNDADCTSNLPSGLPMEINQANCLVGWQQVSEGTTDAWNALSFGGFTNNFPDSIPLPAPDGYGMVGFWIGTSNAFFTTNYREYIGACIDNTPLQAGVSYTLRFHLGFMQPELSPNEITYSPSPVELAVFGVTDCSNLFFNSAQCPLVSGAYVQLGTVLVSGTPGQWTQAEITFNPGVTIRGLVLGGSCAADIPPPADTLSYGNYYFLDNLILNQTAVFSQQVVGSIEAVSGTPCDGNLVLAAPVFPAATYQWYKEGVAIPGAQAQQYQVPPGSAGLGVYQVRVDFGTNCGVSEDYLVALPQVGLTIPDTTFHCPGTVSINFAGPFDTDYLWTFQDTTYTGPFLITSEPGVIYVTATRECVSVTDSVVVLEISPPAFEIVATDTLVCSGASVTLTATGPAGLFFYNWYDLSGNTLSFFPDSMFTLTVSQDTVVVAEAFDLCFQLRDTFEIRLRAGIEVSADIQNVTCSQSTGSITLTPMSGAAVVTYAWQNTAGVSLGSDFSISNLLPGVYTVTISDDSGCPPIVQSYTVEDQTDLTVLVQTSPALCFGDDSGSATVQASNGTPPFSYVWQNTSGTLNAGNATLSDVFAGDYFLTVTDAQGCVTSLNFSIEEPAPLQVIASVVPIPCNTSTGGQVIASASGGVAPYLFRLSAGVFQPNPVFDNLGPGTYAVQVQDANGCESPLVDAVLSEPTTFTIYAGDDREVELGESTVLEVLTSIPDIGSVRWSPPEYLFCDTCLTTEVTPLNSRTYIVTVNDKNGCTLQDTVTISVLKKLDIYVPNVFSPNDDGLNDVLELYHTNAVQSVPLFNVYDRWGNWLHNGAGNQAWDGTFRGKKMPAGVYTWSAEVIFLDGSRQKLSGDVLIVN